MTYVSHEIPDYPVGNLEMARAAREKHAECDWDCEARRYFTQRVPELEREQQ